MMFLCNGAYSQLFCDCSVLTRVVWVLNENTCQSDIISQTASCVFVFYLLINSNYCYYLKQHHTAVTHPQTVIRLRQLECLRKLQKWSISFDLLIGRAACKLVIHTHTHTHVAPKRCTILLIKGGGGPALAPPRLPHSNSADKARCETNARRQRQDGHDNLQIDA